MWLYVIGACCWLCYSVLLFYVFCLFRLCFLVDLLGVLVRGVADQALEVAEALLHANNNDNNDNIISIIIISLSLLLLVVVVVVATLSSLVVVVVVVALLVS